LALFIIWPLRYVTFLRIHCNGDANNHTSLYGTAYQFSKKFFTGWVIVSLLWAIFAFAAVTVFPVIEGRHLLLEWTKELFGKGTKTQHGDEFDHHQHNKQPYDISPASLEEKQVHINTSAPLDANLKL
jgi:hypothetical protein